MNRQTADVESRQVPPLPARPERAVREGRDLGIEDWSELALREIHERNHRIHRLESGIIGRDRRIEKLESQIETLERKISEIFEEIPKNQRKIAHLQSELIQIRTSTAWKIAGFLDRYFPVYFLKLFFWTITGKLPAKLREDRIYRELQNSGLFDPEYYLRVNPDVADAGADPLKHYIDNYRQGRNPNPDFDTLAYLQNHPDIEINPLLHYARVARSRGER